MPWCSPWPTRPRWSLPPTCSDNSFCHHSAAEAMNLITQFNLVVGCPPQCTAWSVALNVDHKPGTHRVLHSEWDRARLLGRPRFRHTLCPWFTHNLSLQHCRSAITFLCAATVTEQAPCWPVSLTPCRLLIWRSRRCHQKLQERNGIIILIIMTWYVQVFDFCFLSTSQEVGWKQHLRNDLFCVKWDVKP